MSEAVHSLRGISRAQGALSYPASSQKVLKSSAKADHLIQ
jgi:hypothetical protein